MKKILTPLIVILVLAGSAYATLVGGLFPSTGDFPRVPQANGTLGHILAKILGESDIELYEGDGTVNNTLALNGITSTGYLQHGTCTVVDQVWTSITPEGTAICDLKGGIYGQVMGTLTGVVGSIKVYDHNGLEKTGIMDGFTLHFGDIVETLGSSSGTIAFSDASIIRLDELSTVELSGGTNSDGDSIAQVILRDGNLWGRVLTSTGINFEAGGYIAGVRGTSISVEKTTTGSTFAIIDSINGGNTAVGIYPLVVVGPATRESSTTNLGSGSIMSVYRDQKYAPTKSPSISKSTLLSGNAWRSSNTLSDIEYLYALISDPTGVAPGLTLTPTEIGELITKAENEVNLTIPKISDCGNSMSCENDPGINECIALGGTIEECQKVNIEPDNIPSTLAVVDGVEDTVDKKRGRQELRARDLLCDKKHGGVYWPTLGKCVKRDPSRGTIIWMADYTTTTSTPPNSRFNDPSLFVEQDIRNTSLLNPNIIAGTNTQAALIGRNFVIPSQYEKYYGTGIIINTCNISQIPGNNISFWKTIGDIDHTSININMTNLNDYLTSTNDFYSFVNQSLNSSNINNGLLDAGFNSIVIKDRGNSTCIDKDTSINWNTSVFPGGVWLRKISNITSPTGPNGITINNTTPYLAYPLSEMGGQGALAGKMVTIELTEPVGKQLPSWSKAYIADFGNEKWFVVNPGSSSSKCNNITVNKLTLCYNKNGAEFDQGQYNKDLRINISPTLYPTQFIIGNQGDNGAGSFFTKPIGTTIKGITITKNEE